MRRHLLLLVCTLAASANAQMRPVVDTISTSSAPGLTSIFQTYQREVAANPADAQLWHDYGISAWKLARSLDRTGSAGTEPARISRLADSALAMAAALDPNSVQYQLDMAWKMQATNTAITRAGSKRYLERAVEAARRKSDPLMIAVAALEYGRTFWWRFDAFENRYLFTGLQAPRSVTDAINPLVRAGGEMEEQAALLAGAEANFAGLNPTDFYNLNPGDQARLMLNVSSGSMQYIIQPKSTLSGALDLLKRTSKPLPGDLSGRPELERATALFSEAYQAAPWYPGAFRAVAMTWLGRNMWVNLERFSTSHLRSYPNDSLAWLALGLAQYRQGKLKAAKSSYDSAFARMNRKERDRLMSWRRILPPQQREKFTEEQLRAYESAYWRTAQPFLADSTRDPRLEFYARVTHAELRWSVEEYQLSGADSDRGDIFIRHGPPNEIMGFGSSVDDYASDVVSFWIYPSGLIFAFSGMPTFSIMRTAKDDRGSVAEMNARFPVGWDNIDAPQIDSLDAQVARFRASGDSVDVAVAVTFGSPDSIAATMSVVAPVQRHLWLIPAGIAGEQHLSERLMGPGIQMWRQRIAPAPHVFRAEAFAETATRGERVTGIIDATSASFPTRGFGVSDILITSSVRDASAQKRWNDLGIVPSQSRITKDAAFTLLWENYEFGNRSNQAEYDVTIAIKNRKQGAAQIAAEIVGALARVAQIQRAPSQVTVTFSRTVPSSPAFADWVSVRMPDAPEGVYDVTLTVQDRVTGAKAVRTTALEIRGQK